ncbi:MAG: hypothetical protein EOP87_05000 [Verrucomicrobiaceae bacterium]|nr:MAG: hypothetical protein EOP87_05000 [Verrucomicrobiaceae bacterium]
MSLLQTLPKSLRNGLLLASAVISQGTANAAEAKWEQAGWGGGGFFWAAEFHPAKEGTIYLGGDVAGIYRTDDHGKQWRMINNGLVSYAVYSVAVDRTNPDTVYAVTEDGVSKSTDAGENWKTLPNTGKKELRITAERDKSVRALAVDPTNGKNLYAASPGGKVYKSVDGGETWTVSWSKETEGADDSLRVQYGKVNSEYFGDIAIPVTVPATANTSELSGVGFTVRGDGSTAKDSYFTARTKAGITYRSKNLAPLYRNTEWQDIVMGAADFIVEPGYAKKNPEAAAKNPTPDWAAIDRFDLAISGNLPGERTVLELKEFFFTSGPADKRVKATIRDFKTDKTLQFFGNIKLGPVAAGTVYAVNVSSKNPSLVLAGTQNDGLLLSKDAGKTWNRVGTPPQAGSSAFDPTNPGIIYGAFHKDGIHKSTDGGKTWTPSSEGIEKGFEIMEVVVSPTNPLDVYAIGSISWNGKFYRSEDGGKTWKSSSRLKVDPAANPTLDNVSEGMTSLSAPTNIAVNPRNGKELFISANWRCPHSADGGVTWTERDAGADISVITDVRFLKNRTFVSVMDEGTLVSDSGGKSWKQLWPLSHVQGFSGHNWRVAVNEVGGKERVISTVSPWDNGSQSTVLSEDGGKTFRIIKDGIPDRRLAKNTMWGRGYPRALAVDPNDLKTVYMGLDGDPEDGHSGGGIFKSTDGGASWSQMPNQPGSRRMFYGLAVDPTDSKRIFWGACGAGGGVWRTEDGGNTWKNVFANENFVWNLHIATDGAIYASGAQLHRSTDHGATWTKLTNFPQHLSTVGLEVDPADPKTIWVSNINWGNTALGGVHKSTDRGATWSNITGDIPFVKPMVLRFNPGTRELWAAGVGLYKIKQ